MKSGTKERAESTLKLQLEWVKAADTKVRYSYAVNVLLIGLIVAKSQGLFNRELLQICVIGLTVFLEGISIFFLLKATFPRLKGPKNSMIFFGEIAKKSSADYVRLFPLMSEASYIKDVLEQTHRNAEIANLKFANVALAMRLLFWSLPLWLFSVYILTK